MPRTDTEMVEEALRRVSHIGSQRGRARAIGVSDSLEVIRRIAAGHIDETTLRVLASAPEVRRLGAPERHAEPEADGEHGERDLGPAQKPER